MTHHRRDGFSLIEFAFVMLIAALLACLAIPSYQSVIRKSRRADAQAVLLQMQLLQEKWRANNSRYSEQAIGAPSAGTGSAVYYRFSVTNTSATTFSVRASAINGKGQDKDRQHGSRCDALAIDQSGARIPTPCW